MMIEVTVLMAVWVIFADVANMFFSLKMIRRSNNEQTGHKKGIEFADSLAP